MKKKTLSGNTLKINRQTRTTQPTPNNVPPIVNNFTFKKLTRYKQSKNKPRTIKQCCDIYKKDITGKTNLPLFNSCKINKYCRKYKCKDIDNKFKKAQLKSLGNNYNTLLMSSLYNKCPLYMVDKTRKRCYNTTMKKFYKDNNLHEVYDKILECDNKTCVKEKRIFNTNLFRIRKNKKIGRLPKLLIIEDLPDTQMIEIN